MADSAWGFKEWRLVIERLGRGEQLLILRKGGIHEGRAGFAFRHPAFFLLPSYFHQQAESLQLEPGESLAEASAGVHRLEFFARCEAAAELRDRAQLDALRGEHCWNEALVEQRWSWAGKGMGAGSVTVALVRVFALERAWEVADGPQFGGCRSWFALGEPPAGWENCLQPVVNEGRFTERRARIFALAPDLAAASVEHG